MRSLSCVDFKASMYRKKVTITASATKCVIKSIAKTSATSTTLRLHQVTQVEDVAGARKLTREAGRSPTTSNARNMILYFINSHCCPRSHVTRTSRNTFAVGYPI